MCSNCSCNMGTQRKPAQQAAQRKPVHHEVFPSVHKGGDMLAKGQNP